MTGRNNSHYDLTKQILQCKKQINPVISLIIIHLEP